MRPVTSDSQQQVLLLDPADRLGSLLESDTSRTDWTVHVCRKFAAASDAIQNGLLPEVILIAVDAGREAQALAAVTVLDREHALHTTRIVVVLDDDLCVDEERFLTEPCVHACCWLSALTPAVLNSIVTSQLRAFSSAHGASRSGDAECIGEFNLQPVDLHAGIDSALRMLGAELDERIEIVREYTDIPKVRCIPSLVNQVFVHLIGNAIDGLHGAGGEIRIATAQRDEHAVIAIRESGQGVAELSPPRMYGTQFRNHGIGAGSGLHRSLSYGILARHGGHLEVDAYHGAYTEVRIHLPINGAVDSTRVIH